MNYRSGEMEKISIIKTIYPVKELPAAVTDGLSRKIYENGVRTLRNCLHEHYEDCPWREQSLYAMDSRNRMLFGYETFQGGNIEYAKDESFTKEILKTVEKIMGAFAERVDETGLLPVFPESSYWNFYEWSEGLDGGEIWRDYTIPQSYDACLNLLYLIVMQRLSELYEKMGICPKEDYKAKADCLKKRIRDYFYDSVRGEFKTCLRGCQASEKYA